jgi:hypothetical protein
MGLFSRISGQGRTGLPSVNPARPAKEQTYGVTFLFPLATVLFFFFPS